MRSFWPTNGIPCTRIGKQLLISAALLSLGGMFASMALGRSASTTESPASVLLVTFDGVDRENLAQPDAASWSVTEAVPGSNRPTRTLFGLLSGIPPALLEGTVADAPRALLLGERVHAQSQTATLWASSHDPHRIRALRTLTPELVRYRRLRAVVRDLKVAAATPGFYWIDVPEPMAGKAVNTVERLARALGDVSLVVATASSADATGSTPVWIRGLGATRGPSNGVSELVSFEAIGGAMHRFLGLGLSPLAEAAWPEPSPLLTETVEADGTVSFTARQQGAAVKVTWWPGGLKDCWSQSGAPGCRWARDRSDVPLDSISPVAPTEQDYRRLENRLLWILERRLD